MSKISDLAKRGIYYTPLETTAPEQQAEEDGDFMRGLKKAGHQIPQTAGGAVALVGDLVGSDGMREYGMDVYQKRADAIEKISKPTDSLSSVMAGEEGTSATDWLQNSAGYVAGQVGTALVTGGIGGFIGKQLARRGISAIVERGATSAIAKQVAEKVATRGARAGALTGIMGLNLTQEAGSIYPDAVHEAENPNYGDRADGTKKGRGFLGELKAKDGNVMTELSVGVNLGGKETEIPTIVPTLTPAELAHLQGGGEPTPAIMDKAVAHAQARIAQGISPFASPQESPRAQVNLPRVVGSSIVAAGVDTAMDALMLGKVMAGGRKAGEGMARAAVREVPLAMAREGVTEGIQTGIERYGAGKELTTADAVREYVDSIGVGMVGGGMGGALSVLHAQKVPDGGPLSRAANTAIDQEILALTNDPDPMVAFPDGSVGTKAQVEAYLKQYPEENGARNEARAKLLGLDGKTGEPLPPEPVEPAPEPEFAASPDEEKSQLRAWADEHEPATLDYAHSLLAAPGMKGKNMMVAPHPDGGGYTVVPSNWLTLDTQATLGELQKPAPKAKEGEAKPEAKPEPVAAPAPAADAAPAEPEWKTNPYTAYKFGDAARAEQFMVNKKADPALFEIQPAGDLFVIKRKATQGESNDSGLAAVHQDGSAGRDSSSGTVAGPERVDGIGAGPVDGAVEQRQSTDGLAGQAAEPDPVHATGSTDADPALISEAAHEAATSPLNTLTEPTQAQKEAGNYKVGRVKLHGLDISIENPAGSTRKGVSPDGKAWENELAHHYGYIRGSTGADGDHVDTFIGANPGSDRVFVVDQIDPATGKFDEHKILLGFDSLEEARAGYAANYEAGWQGGKDVSETSVAGFKAWLNEGDTTKPYAPQADAVDVERNSGTRFKENPASWVIREKATGNVIMETFDREKVDALNTEKYEAVSIYEHLTGLNKTVQESAAPRDTGEGIPKAFYKKVKVSHDVHVEETGAVEPVEIPADKALASVREDIQNLQALLKCMKGGA